MAQNPSWRESVIVAMNGPMGPPAEALVHYLKNRAVKAVALSQAPLNSQDDRSRAVTIFYGNGKTSKRTIRLPNRPPLTYPLDAVDLLSLPKASIWIGLNPFATLRGLFLRRIGRAEKVVHWSIDYSPRRFKNSAIEGAYQYVDYICASRCDLRVELTQEARESRNMRHKNRKSKLVEARIVPLGVWLDRYPVAQCSNLDAPIIAFIGHLVPRMGTDLAIRSVALLKSKGVKVRLQIAGKGPELETLRSLVEQLDLNSQVNFLGFLPTEADVQNWLSTCAVAVAPYRHEPDSISRFADPGKLKNYMIAGLPMVVTDVPPIARTLELKNSAIIVQPDPESIAMAIEGIIQQSDQWKQRSQNVLKFASDYDWNRLLQTLLEDPALI